MPEFPRVAEAIHSTLEYYKLANIKTHIKILSGKELNPGVYESTYETVFLLHKRMGEEMDQTLTTSIRYAQVYLFELLKEWLEDYRIADVHVPTIEAEINKYNDDLYSAFILAIEKKMEDYFSKYEYIGEGGEYEEEGLPFYLNYKPKKIFRKIYCIETIPDFIDTDYLPPYLVKVNRLLVSLRANIYRYIKLYNHLYGHDKLKSIGNQEIINLPPQDHPKLLSESNPTSSKRLKVNLTVDQLAYLFRLLSDEGLIDVLKNTEIHEFIANNFETPKTVGKGISLIKLEGSFSSPESKTAKSLIPILRRMQDAASKL